MAKDLANIPVIWSQWFVRTPAVWPDWPKFRHFGKKLKAFGKFLKVYILFGKMLSLLWQICYIIGLIFIVVVDQILNNNLTIGSNWSALMDSAKFVFSSPAFAWMTKRRIGCIHFVNKQYAISYSFHVGRLSHLIFPSYLQSSSRRKFNLILGNFPLSTLIFWWLW